MKRRNKKPEIWWCIKNFDGRLLASYGSYTRAAAVDKLSRDLPGYTWKELRDKGFKPVKFKLIEVKS